MTRPGRWIVRGAIAGPIGAGVVILLVVLDQRAKDHRRAATLPAARPGGSPAVGTGPVPAAGDAVTWPGRDGTVLSYDPTDGRIDHDIQWAAEAMRPVSRAQWMAIAHTLQDRRGRAVAWHGLRAP